MKQIIATSKNNIPIFIDLDDSNLGLHVREQPNLIDLVKEVIANEIVEGDEVALERDLGRVIGQTTLVKTTESDEIIYAIRHGRETYTRFVKGKMPSDTSWLTIILFKKDEEYKVWSAWCGRLVPKSPQATDDVSKSEGFWKNHALVYDESLIQAGTESTNCPW